MWGQIARAERLPAAARRHTRSRPITRAATNEGFCERRSATRSRRTSGFGRAWSPMTEVIVAKPKGGDAEWDVVPQMQVSLSKLQHILLERRRPRAAQRARGPQAAVPHLFPVGLVRRRPVPVLEVIDATLIDRSHRSCRSPARSGCWRVCRRAAGRAGQPARPRAATRTPCIDDLSLFTHSENCVACHNNLVTPAGEDVSIGATWRSTMMANSARDPYWQAGVRRETIDHPSTPADDPGRVRRVPHADGARGSRAPPGGKGEVFAHLPIAGADDRRLQRLAADSISCTRLPSDRARTARHAARASTRSSS